MVSLELSTNGLDHHIGPHDVKRLQREVGEGEDEGGNVRVRDTARLVEEETEKEGLHEQEGEIRTPDHSVEIDR